MKIAIFHDYFDEIGGAETTTLIMARALNANIYTTNIDFNKIKELGFDDVKIKSVGSVVKIKYLKQIHTSIKFYFLKNKNYDLNIFTGSYSVYASKKQKKNLWFCLSLLTGLYESQNNIFYIKFFKKIEIFFNTKAVNKVKKIISNSKNTQKTVKKYYNRKSKIINDPVELKKFCYKDPQNYWLSVNRIDPCKEIETQIKVFQNLSAEKLLIVGGCSNIFTNYFKYLKKQASLNIEFKKEIINKKKLSELYANCKGLICTSKNETLGKSAIEAMASGKPVIAPNEGGYKETIINGKTGILIKDINPEKLEKAIKKLDKELKDKKNQLKYKKACQEQAKKFDVDIFVKKIKTEIENTK